MVQIESDGRTELGHPSISQTSMRRLKHCEDKLVSKARLVRQRPKRRAPLRYQEVKPRLSAELATR